MVVDRGVEIAVDIEHCRKAVDEGIVGCTVVAAVGCMAWLMLSIDLRNITCITIIFEY
jgi:hypothetical protein